MRIARLFGLKADPTVGGSNYDSLTAGAIPDADEFWPINTANLDKNQSNLNRDGEVGVDPFGRPDVAFEQRPVVTAGGFLYFSLAKRLLPLILAVEGSLSGVPPAAITHPFSPLPYGSTLPLAKMLQLVRDDLNQKVSGAILNRLALTFPFDGFATWEAEFFCLYQKNDPAALPSAAYTGVSSQPMLIRDMSVFLDGSGVSIPNLTAVTWEYRGNVIEPQYQTGRNRVPITPGSQTMIWMPGYHKAAARRNIQVGLTFADADVAQELKRDFATPQKVVMEALGGPMATTPAANELVRLTNYSFVATDGGPEALSATDNITANYTGPSVYSAADSKTLLCEIVDNVDAALLP